LEIRGNPQIGSMAELLLAGSSAGVALDWHIQVQYAKVISI